MSLFQIIWLITHLLNEKRSFPNRCRKVNGENYFPQAFSPLLSSTQVKNLLKEI